MFGKAGWDAAEESEQQAKADAASRSGSGSVFEFSVPFVNGHPPMSRAFLVLDDIPLPVWRHSMYGINAVVRGKQICLKRNKISDDCPLCDMAERSKKGYASLSNLFTVIECGMVTLDLTKEDAFGQPAIKALRPYVKPGSPKPERVYMFQKQTLSLNVGTPKHEGMFEEFKRWRTRKGGSLVGAFFVSTRKGDKEHACGTSWNYYGKYDVSSLDALKSSLMSLPGCPPEINSPDHEVFKYLSAEPIDFMKVLQVPSQQQLALMTNDQAIMSKYVGKQAHPVAEVVGYDPGTYPETDNSGDIPF